LSLLVELDGSAHAGNFDERISIAQAVNFLRDQQRSCWQLREENQQHSLKNVPLFDRAGCATGAFASAAARLLAGPATENMPGLDEREREMITVI